MSLRLKNIIGIIGLIGLLGMCVFISSGLVLEFGFWKDDWIGYWGAKQFSLEYYRYWYHPGTTIQFALLSFLLEPNSIGWQFVGIGWKIAASVGVLYLFRELFHDKLIPIVGALLFASSPLGIDAVGWPSANVVLMGSFLLTITTAWWFRRIKNNQSLRHIPSIVLLCVTLCVDPFRTAPIMAMILFLMLYFQNRVLISRDDIRRYGPYLIPFSVIGSYWIIQYVRDTTLFKFVQHTGLEISEYLSRAYVIKHYISNIVNLSIGHFIPVSEFLSTGEYDRIGFVLGCLFFILCLVFIIHLKRIRSSMYFPALFFFLWMNVFLIPNYFSEVRLVLGATHRYMSIASIGWIGMICVGLQILRLRIRIIVGLALIFISIQTSRSILYEWIQYRSRDVLMHIWNGVDLAIPQDVKPKIIVFSGSNPIISNVLSYSGGVPFAVLRGVRQREDFPFISSNMLEVKSRLCESNYLGYPEGLSVISEKITKKDMYFFSIEDNGHLVDESSKKRATLDQLPC